MDKNLLIKTIVLAILCVIGLMLICSSVILTAKLGSIFAGLVGPKLVFTNTSSSFKSWQSSSTPIYYTLTMFSMTNPDEFLLGHKPKFIEVGPYVYRQYRTKQNVSFSDGGRKLHYRYKKSYTFVPEKSVNDPKTQNVTIINPVLSTLLANVASSFTILVILEMVHSERIVKTGTVDEFLWGYDDPYLKSIMSIRPSRMPSSITGLLRNDNGSVTDEFVINSGVPDYNDIGQLLSYGGKSQIDMYQNVYDNKINGSDGTMFGPHVTIDKTLTVYSPDACRSFDFDFKAKEVAKNDDRIELYKFVARKRPADRFCVKNAYNTTCRPAGLMDLSVCRRRGELTPPIIVSQPHFYGVDKSLYDRIEGIKEPSEEDETVIYIEPNTGLLIQAFKRIQMNIYINSNSLDRREYKNLTGEYYLPVFIGMESVVPSSETLARLYDKVIGKKIMVHTIFSSILVVGVLLSLISAILLGIILTRRMERSRSNIANTLYVLVPDSSNEPIINSDKANGDKKTIGAVKIQNNERNNGFLNRMRQAVSPKKDNTTSKSLPRDEFIPKIEADHKL